MWRSKLAFTHYSLWFITMSTQPTTPTSRSTHHPTTPVTTRLTSTHIIQSSPHYTTTRRHSLYGVEDRVIIDPGSRIWKVGFSGEGKPRDVFCPVGPGDTLWNLSRAADPQERAEEDRVLEIRLQKSLRSVFHEWVDVLVFYQCEWYWAIVKFVDDRSEGKKGYLGWAPTTAVIYQGSYCENTFWKPGWYRMRFPLPLSNYH